MVSVRKEHQNIIYLIGLSICFLLALAVFSCYTSPLYPGYYGYDSAIFSLIGKGISEGKEMYTELFDHKGPVIFFINALGYYIGGRTGIFLLQAVFGIVSLCFCYYTGLLLRPEKKFSSFWECFAIFFSVYAAFFFTFQRGNLTEEYSLAFISCSMYLFVRYAVCVEINQEHSPWYALVHGINFGCLAFLRLNNAASVGMGVLIIAIFLIAKRKYSNLFMNLLFGGIGLSIVIVPIMLYFMWHGSVSEMLYATFIHNFVIAGNTGHLPLKEDPIKFFILYLPIALCCLLVFSRLKSRKIKFIDALLIAVLGINIVSLWIANRFPHYFTVFSPVYAVFLLSYSSFDKRRITAVILSVCTCMNLAMSCYFSYSSIKDVYIDKTAAIRNDTIYLCAQQIPENERSSVIGYKINAADYLSADIVPCYKYYTLQDTWALTNPLIMTEFVEWLRNEKPLWVMIYAHESDSTILNILDEYYAFQFSNGLIDFYRVVD